MAHPYKNLRDKMSPKSRARARALTDTMRVEIKLRELREQLNMSQEQVAELLDIRQASVSKMERRAAMSVATLRRYIEALGGKLVLKAKFPDREVGIGLSGPSDKS